MLDFIPWSPIVYYAVVGLLQLIVLLLVGALMGIRWDIQGAVGSVVVCGLLAVMSYVTRQWELGALLLYLVASFVGAGFVTKGEALPAFIGSIAMTAIFFVGSHLFIAPNTPLSIKQVGGASYFMRYYDHYKMPFDNRDYNEKDPDKLVQGAMK